MNFLFVLLIATSARAEFDGIAVRQYFNWLSETEKHFSECKVELKNGYYILCDNTKVSKAHLMDLAKKNQVDIEKFLSEKNIKTIKLCDLKKIDCVQADSKTQRQMSHLHGLYSPTDNSITFKDGSSTGVLIHEYVHYLQSRNENPINGKVYKKSRLEIQKKITAELDRLEKKIKEAEKNKNQKEIMTQMQKFISVNDHLLEFGKWQDLVDERSIFLLYKSHGKDIGLQQSDIDFAKKKLTALCENKNLKPILPDCK